MLGTWLSGNAFLDFFFFFNSELKPRGPKEAVFWNGDNIAYVEGLI